MKRKQKTPRRLRPSDISEADHDQPEEPIEDPSTQDSTDVNLKRQKIETSKLEAEIETCATNVDTKTVPCSIAGRPSTHFNGIFRNESDSPEMPLILDVYSLSAVQPAQPNAMPKLNNTFPVTPPCSPPLAQFNNVKGNPMVRYYYQYPQENRNCSVLPVNTYVGPQMTILGDPQPQYYNATELVVDNPDRIANGVLPVERPTTAKYVQQNKYTHTQSNTTNYYNHPSSHFTNGGKNPIDHLREMFISGNKYLRSKESTVSNGNNLYTPFKLRENSMVPRAKQFVAAPGTFPIGQRHERENIPNNDRPKSIPKAVRATAGAENQENRSSTSSASNSLPSNVRYTTEGAYGVVLKGYGKNELLYNQPQTQKEPPSNLYHAISSSNRKSSGSDRPSENISSSNDDNQDIFTPSEMKVQKLKRLLEEQEQALKKLRTNH